MSDKKQKKQWKNAIVGHDNVDPNLLMPNPENWRLHEEFQQRAMNDVLSEVGWIQSVIVNKPTGRIVDGHLRVKLAIEKKELSVPVVYVDLSEEEEKKALLTLDPLGELAVGDISAFTNLSDDITTDSLWIRELMQKTSEKILGEENKDLEEGEENEINNIQGREVPEMELSAFEHYDYICMIFKTDQDFLDASDYFSLEKVEFKTLSGSKKIGVGRVIDGAVAMKKIRGFKDEY